MLINRPQSLIVTPTYLTGSSYAEGFTVGVEVVLHHWSGLDPEYSRE
jgi:hypothetical protein